MPLFRWCGAVRVRDVRLGAALSPSARATASAPSSPPLPRLQVPGISLFKAAWRGFHTREVTREVGVCARDEAGVASPIWRIYPRCDPTHPIQGPQWRSQTISPAPHPRQSMSVCLPVPCRCP